MVREFERAVRRELDLRNEARSLVRFREMFAGRTDTYIPSVYEELSSADVLVMEFIRGKKITDAARYLPEEQREALVRTCFDILFTMVLRERFFHGDLHPGNVFLTDEGAIALLDLGLVGRLTPTMRDQVVDLLLALTQRDWQAVSEAFFDMAVRTRQVSMREFASEVADVMDASIDGRTLSELEIGAVLGRIGDIGVRFGMRVPSEYAMMIKAILTVEGVGKALAPGVDPVEVARPYVSTAIRERYGPERLTGEGVRALLALSRLARELPPTLREMVSSVEAGRVRLGVDLTTTRELAPILKTALAPVTDAVLVGGLVVAGALSLRFGEAAVAGLPLVSLVLFTLAGLAAIRLALRNRRG
jgi:ubiquinone biosynthesis protein